MVTGRAFGNVKEATIEGVKWHDLDGDGVKDPDEPGLAGWTIFVDRNGSGFYRTLSRR